MANSKQHIINWLDQKSKFFCPAKWEELFLYLNHGNSNSCSHPIPHQIPAELLDDPFVLHNTPHKLKMQELMISGQRPEECHMCWHIEDTSDDAVSERLFKSDLWKPMVELEEMGVSNKYIPRQIEVIFDNTCNLSCSYCDSGQSSVWANRINTHPLLLKTDYRKLYINAFKESDNADRYFDAWMQWWPQIKDHLLFLKLSGGEPLLSKKCWAFINTIGVAKQLQFSINSNLSVDTSLIEKFATISSNFKKITISASVDASGAMAEYARQGLNYNLFLKNVHRWCSITPDNCIIGLQNTVSVFNIWGVTDVFDLAIDLRKLYPNKIKEVYSTIVRFPEFQSISILPDFLKDQLRIKIENWLDRRSDELTENETLSVERIIIYLRSSPQMLYNLNKQYLVDDLCRFITYYDKTSPISFNDIYPKDFVNWINEQGKIECLT